jgi:hypothetical protein
MKMASWPVVEAFAVPGRGVKRTLAIVRLKRPAIQPENETMPFTPVHDGRRQRKKTGRQVGQEPGGPNAAGGAGTNSDSSIIVGSPHDAKNL